MSIVKNKKRVGNFTSSNIFKLIKKGTGKNAFSVPGITYIKERAIERKLNRSLDTDAYSQATSWGNVLESYVAKKLGDDYELVSDVTFTHDKHVFWSGSPDMFFKPNNKKEAISEIKCFQLKMFAQYSDVLMKKDVELFKKEFPKEYWQIVSNCCIHNLDVGEAIIFAPYESDMEDVRLFVDEYISENETNLWRYRFIQEKENYELPTIPLDSTYNDMTKFSFIVPEEDKKLLESRILEAEKFLNESKTAT